MKPHVMKAVCLLLLLSVFACTKQSEKKINIGFSQAMTTDDWRKQMDKSMQIEASLRKDVKLEITDAQNNIAKQIADIESFIAQKKDIIIVSPIQSFPLTQVVKKAIAANIPVLIIDRKIEGEAFTAYVGADNIEVGRNAANYIILNSSESKNIIEITGLRGSSPADERSLGFEQVLSKEKDFTILGKIFGDWEKESVRIPLKKLLEQHPNVGFIFAHNDRMALGAWETARNLGREKSIKIIGVDGLNTINGGIQHVKDGKLEATVFYPTGGNEAIKLALRMYYKEQVPKNNNLSTIIINKLNAEIIENQMDKIDQQQSVIDSQQNAIRVQEDEYATQNNLLRLLTISFLMVLGLAGYSIFSTIFISRKKRQLEAINKTVVTQSDEIVRMSEIAKESNEAKINFFTGLSHEFKTPLTLIMSYAESLIENEKIRGTDLREEVRLIHSNSERLLRLINQLLDFRKIEAQKFNLRASKTNIFDFSTEIIKNFKAEAARRNIDFLLTAQKKDTDIYIDRSLMDKVYYNVISNAFKFTPDNGKIHIQINDESKNVKIVFRDSGIGIPDQEINQVFHPFFRASNNTKNSSGIGLNLSREFVFLHKGTIDVKSKHGTEFVISLPKGTAHLLPEEILEKVEAEVVLNDALLDPQPLAKTALKNTSDHEKHAVLIVEDHADLIHFLSSKLQGDYDVIMSDGTDAVEKALQTIPDIIICDVNLNGADGFEISKILKKDLRTSHIPIIILTALSNKESVLLGLQAGIDQYITKPFSLAILKQALSNLIYNRERLRYYYTNNIYRIDPEAKFGLGEQGFIAKMNDFIKQNLNDSANPKFSVEDLAYHLGISRVQLYRKVKAILGINVSDYINTIRLEYAAELLKSDQMNISEIAYALGFSSPNYFSVSFKNKFGISPKEFKK